MKFAQRSRENAREKSSIFRTVVVKNETPNR